MAIAPTIPAKVSPKPRPDLRPKLSKAPPRRKTFANKEQYFSAFDEFKQTGSFAIKNTPSTTPSAKVAPPTPPTPTKPVEPTPGFPRPEVSTDQPRKTDFPTNSAYFRALKERKKTGSFMDTREKPAPTEPTAVSPVAPTVAPTVTPPTTPTVTPPPTPEAPAITPEVLPKKEEDPFLSALERFKAATGKTERQEEIETELLTRLIEPTDFLKKYEDLKETSGLDKLQSTIQSVNQQVTDLEKQLEDTEEQFTEATRQVDVTEAQAQRRIEKEKEPIRDQLVKLIDDVATLSEENRIETEDIRFRLGLSQEAEAQQLTNLETMLNLTKVSDADRDLARETFRFELEKIQNDEQRKITAQDAAKVNAKILANLSLAENVDPDDPAFQFKMAELETQAGLPIGTFAALQEAGGGDWKVEKVFDSYERDGVAYNDILVFDNDTGRPKIKTVERVGGDTLETGAIGANLQAIVSQAQTPSELASLTANLSEDQQNAASFAWARRQSEVGNLTPEVKQLNLNAASSGKLTKASLSELLNEAKRTGDVDYIKRIGNAVISPINKPISSSQAEKSSTPTGITQGQFDEIIKRREEAGFGNKEFQKIDLKTINKEVVPMLDLEQDLRSMRAIKEGWDYIKTLPPEEQTRIRDDYDFLNEDYNGVNTGAIAGRVVGFRQALDVGDPEESVRARGALNTIAGKYTVEFMKAASGVAISENEARRLAKLVPTITLEDQQFLDNLKEATGDLADKVSANTAKFGVEGIDGLREVVNKRKSGLFSEIADDIVRELDFSDITRGIDQQIPSIQEFAQQFGDIQGLKQSDINELFQEQYGVSGASPGKADVPPSDLQVEVGTNRVSINLQEGTRLIGASKENINGQCGFARNQIAKKLGINEHVGDSKSSKLKTVKKDTPNIPELGGSFVSMVSPYGHIGTIEAYSSPGQSPSPGDTIVIFDSNRGNDRRSSRRVAVFDGDGWKSREFGEEKIHGFGRGVSSRIS